MTDEMRTLCDQEIQAFIYKVALIKADKSRQLFVSNSFFVPKPTDGFRFIFYLKPFNKFVFEEHFQMEGLGVLVPVHYEFSKFLQIVWKDDLYEYLSPLRSFDIPLGIHKSVETYCFLYGQRGNPPHYLS